MKPELLFALLSQKDVLRWLKNITETRSSIYDKAMDENYNDTNIGGGDHRLFDGGHDLKGAWEACRDASKDDALIDEFTGFISGVFKDASTVKGMPFVTISQEHIENIYKNFPILNKEYVKDILTYDTIEVFSATLGVAFTLFSINKKDQIAVGKMLGSLSLVGTVSGNPIMLIASILLAIYAYKFKGVPLDKKSILNGATNSTISLLIFSTLGLNILIELAIVIAILNLFNNSSTEKIISLVDDYYQKITGVMNKAIKLTELSINELKEINDLNLKLEKQIIKIDRRNELLETINQKFNNEK